jgi:hypothetical protein
VPENDRDEPIPATPEDALEQLGRFSSGLASQRPLFAAGFNAQVLRMITELSGTQGILKHYRLPEETIKILGFRNEQLADSVRALSESARFKGLFVSPSWVAVADFGEGLRPIRTGSNGLLLLLHDLARRLLR